MDNLVGQVIKGYKLLELIGRGGFGVVYRAYQPLVEREVAVKIISSEYAGHPNFIQRFEIEAKLIARLEHPHIVPLFDYWREADRAYLVMRWLRGGSARAMLQRGPLDVVFVARLLDQIAAALTVAHQHNIVHRDLKPDNILLDENGNAYLADFGIAKDLTGVHHITQTGSVVGSPAYLSPEQVMGETATPQTDLYSLGIVLYELLTGRHPFPNLSVTALIAKHLNESLPPLNLTDAHLSSALNAVIQRTTAKAPADRYPDALSLAAAFRQAAAYGDTSLSGGGALAAPNVGTVTQAESRPMFHTPVAHLPESETFHGGDLEAKFCEKIESVPNRPRRLIGRDALLDEVHALLDENDRVLLQGFGGIGKTALAATIAAERIERGKSAVIWLEAGSEDVDTLFEAVAQTFGIQREIAGALPHTRTEIIRSRLREQNALLVLDNVWNERALFQMMKAVPESIPLLVTSRYAIPLDGAIVRVEKLSAEDALALLGYHARKDYHSDADARALCETLGNHPLALQIAGSRVKVQRQLTPGRLIKRIADAPHDLEAPGQFVEMGRESVKELLDDSVNELGPALREVFVMLGAMFAPVASVELLALTIGRDWEAVEDALVDLERGGLVTELVFEVDNAPIHYRIHDLTYSYARAMFKLAHSRQMTIEAVARYVEKHAQDYDALCFERNNILGATKLAHQVGDDEALVHIMALLATQGYFDARGHTIPCLRRLDDAIAAARQMGPAYAEPLHYMLSKRGNAYADRRDLDNAIKTYKEALALAPNPNRRAILLSIIGAMYVRKDSSKADDYFEQAYQLAAEHNDDHALSFTLVHRGDQAFARQEFETARSFFAEAVAVAERAQDDARLFMALLNRGAAEEELGRYEQALATHRQVYQIAESAGNHIWMAHALHAIGEDYHAMGRHDEAQDYLSRGLALYHSIGAMAMVDEITAFMQKSNYVIRENA